MSELTRRRLIQSGLVAAASVSFGPGFWREAFAAPPTVIGPGPYGPLLPPDANGLMLPSGFTSRVVARAGQAMPGQGYVFPAAPDGQATYPLPDGGWILVTNSEIAAGAGGVSAIRFDAGGTVVDAYRILANTSVNCAGGPTPWGTWLSCEETDTGKVWECDPTGNSVAIARPGMGAFKHEACCVDTGNEHVYLSEDFDGGCFYRFVPDAYPDLSAGTLQVAAGGDTVTWLPVPDPLLAGGTPLRDQVAGALRFRRGEGIWFDSGLVYLVTTADETVHTYDTRTGKLGILYRAADVPGTPLAGVDNIHISGRSGDVFLAEDNGLGADAMDVVILSPNGQIARFMKMTGAEQTGSETVGLTFDPSGTRFYVGSQRFAGTGIVYEVKGRFRPVTSQPPASAALVGLAVTRGLPFATLISRGLTIAFTLDKAATVRLRLTARVMTNGKRRTVTLASSARRRRAGMTTTRLEPTRAGARLLRARKQRLTATLELRIATPGEKTRIVRQSVRLRPR